MLRACEVEPELPAPRVLGRRRQEAGAGSGPAAALSPAALLHLQRLAGNEAVGGLLEEGEEEPSPVREVVGSGGGSPLEPGIRGAMEERLGHDFADVRVHTGPAADESARSIGALAYTAGDDVVFRSGAYEPGTSAGRRTLVHELTHVVQQRAGPVAGTPAPGGILLSDPGDRFELAAQRQAEEEEEEEEGEGEEAAAVQTVRGLSVQRQVEEGARGNAGLDAPAPRAG